MDVGQFIISLVLIYLLYSLINKGMNMIFKLNKNDKSILRGYASITDDINIHDLK